MITPRNSILSQEELEERYRWVRMYQAGASLREVADKIGVTPQCIKYWINRFGLKARPWKVETKRIQDLSDTDRAYLAGILDGEGTFGIYGYPYKRPQLRVANTSWELIEWLRNIGGAVRIQKPGERNPLNQTRKIWLWEPTSHIDIAYVLRSCLPYMTAKKAQAEKVLSFIEDRLRGGTQ